MNLNLNLLEVLHYHLLLLLQLKQTQLLMIDLKLHNLLHLRQHLLFHHCHLHQQQLKIQFLL